MPEPFPLIDRSRDPANSRLFDYGWVGSLVIQYA